MNKKFRRTKENGEFRGRVFVLKKRWLAVIAGLAAAAAVFCAVCSPRMVGAAATTRRLPIYCVERDDKVCSLTFDAAWGNEDTQQLIDILARYKVKATFFVVGDWVEKFPESVKALSDAGHEVMNHSDDHAHFSQLSADEIVANINACSDKIEAVTGKRPTLFRAPYGEYDDKVIAAVDGMGVKTIQWDVETLATVGTPHSAGIFDDINARRDSLRAFRIFAYSNHPHAVLPAETVARSRPCPTVLRGCGAVARGADNFNAGDCHVAALLAMTNFGGLCVVGYSDKV